MASTAPVAQYAGSSSSSEGSITDLKGDEGWEDAEDDLVEETFISLLDDEVFPNIKSMLEHCKKNHNFDFLELRQRVTYVPSICLWGLRAHSILRSDFYDNIKLVNFIRSQVHSTWPFAVDSSLTEWQFNWSSTYRARSWIVLNSTPQASSTCNSNLNLLLGGLPVSSTISKSDFEDDKFLKPVLEDDALLISLDDLPELPSANATSKDTEPSTNLVTRVSELEEELRRIQSQFDSYRSTVEETLDERWNDKSKGKLLVLLPNVAAQRVGYLIYSQASRTDRNVH